MKPTTQCNLYLSAFSISAVIAFIGIFTCEGAITSNLKQEIVTEEMRSFYLTNNMPVEARIKANQEFQQALKDSNK